MVVWTLAAYRRTRSPIRLVWSDGRRPLGAVLHSSNEPDELSQWLCHDDSTINTGAIIIVIIIHKEDLCRPKNNTHALGAEISSDQCKQK